jgi:hypothetical protein
MKKSIIFAVLAMHMSVLFGQFQMTSVGNVGIGTTSPIGKLEVHGDGLWLTYNGHILRMKPNNPATEIGSSDAEITFWYTTCGYNWLNARGYNTLSDSNEKKNITPITNALSYLLQFKGYSYNFKDDTSSIQKTHYGFLSQDIQSFLPDLVDSAKSKLLLNYDEIIPFLVEAIKIQNNEIDSLKIQLETVKSAINEAHDLVTGIIERCCPIDDSLRELLPGQSNNDEKQSQKMKAKNILFQNNPNPFSHYTTIRYYLVDNSINAKIELYDMSGNKVKSLINLKNGEGEIIINAAELQPGAYTYILSINNNVIDSKILMITK